MIEMSRILFAWPTVAGVWDDIMAAPAESPMSGLVAWYGTRKGAVAVRLIIAVSIVTYLPYLLLPRPRVRRVGFGDRALFIRWLLWEFYFGPKLPVVVGAPLPVPADPSKFLTLDQIAELTNEADFESHVPPSGISNCTYCGAETKMHPYREVRTNREWPACCGKIECMDKWEPLKGENL